MTARWRSPWHRSASGQTRRPSRGLWALLVPWIAWALHAAAPPAAAEGSALRYGIVVTGGEILDGTISDGHTSFLSRALRPLGATCVGSFCVDDVREDLRQVLELMSGKAPLILVTGGLGPTVNDITRETVSEFTGIPLRDDPELLAELGRRFNTAPGQLRDNLRRQTRVPVRGRLFANRQGTAVGLVFEAEPAVIVALPGPPRELQPMVREELIPWLQQRFGLHASGASLTLRFIGLGQSAIDQALREAQAVPPETIVGSQFEGSRVDFTFTRRQDTPDDRRQLQALEEKARSLLGRNLYATGSTTLEEAALRFVAEQGGTVALAEIASGGALGAALTRVPGVRPLVAGAFVARDGEALGRMLGIRDADWRSLAGPAEHVKALAETARRLAGARWALAVGEAAPTAGRSSTVWVAFGSPAGQWELQSLELWDPTEAGRASLINEVLDRLRRVTWRPRRSGLKRPDLQATAARRRPSGRLAKRRRPLAVAPPPRRTVP